MKYTEGSYLRYAGPTNDTHRTYEKYEVVYVGVETENGQVYGMASESGSTPGLTAVEFNEKELDEQWELVNDRQVRENKDFILMKGTGLCKDFYCMIRKGSGRISHWFDEETGEDFIKASEEVFNESADNMLPLEKEEDDTEEKA